MALLLEEVKFVIVQRSVHATICSSKQQFLKAKTVCVEFFPYDFNMGEMSAIRLRGSRMACPSCKGRNMA